MAVPGRARDPDRPSERTRRDSRRSARRRGADRSAVAGDPQPRLLGCRGAWRRPRRGRGGGDRRGALRGTVMPTTNRRAVIDLGGAATILDAAARPYAPNTGQDVALAVPSAAPI